MSAQMTCPNCGFYYDAEVSQDPRADVIWPCSIQFDKETEITTHKYECSACGRYFYLEDHPLWEHTRKTVGEKAASNDTRP